MKKRNFWNQIMWASIVLTALAIISALIKPDLPARAQVRAPQIKVSCSVEPQVIQPGEIGTLHVSVHDVPPETERGYGMTSYDVKLTWATSGSITFTENKPRPGPEPWDGDLWELPNYNFINNQTGNLSSVRVMLGPSTSFSGSSVLFSAPFTANQEGTLPFQITTANIPYYALGDIPYQVTIENCSAVIEEGNFLFLPIVNRKTT